MKGGGSNNTANSSSSPGKKENNKTLAERENNKNKFRKKQPMPTISWRRKWLDVFEIEFEDKYNSKHIHHYPHHEHCSLYKHIYRLSLIWLIRI